MIRACCVSQSFEGKSGDEGCRGWPSRRMQVPVPITFIWCYQEARKAAAEQCRKVPAVSTSGVQGVLTRYPLYTPRACCLEVGTPHAPGDLAFQRWGCFVKVST